MIYLFTILIQSPNRNILSASWSLTDNWSIDCWLNLYGKTFYNDNEWYILPNTCSIKNTTQVLIHCLLLRSNNLIPFSLTRWPEASGHRYHHIEPWAEFHLRTLVSRSSRFTFTRGEIWARVYCYYSAMQLKSGSRKTRGMLQREQSLYVNMLGIIAPLIRLILVIWLV